MITKFADFLNESSREASYELPDSLYQLFESVVEMECDCTFYITDYDLPMNNIEAMQLFLHEVDISDEFIVSNEGTEVVVISPDYPGRIRISSYGNGNEFSHAYECTEVKE